MNLKEIRKWFVRDSGRFDLVVDTTDWVDNGADKYVNAGLRWLDRQVSMSSQYAKFFRELAIGDYVLSVGDLRSVTCVHVRDSTGDVKELGYKTYEELREYFGKSFSEVTTGPPLFYGLINLRQYDEAESDPPSTESLTSAGWKTSDGILITPPPSESTVVIIEGKFKSATLAADEDENFWSVNEPSVLVKAGLRELEAFYRNTAGVQDWTNSIVQDLIGIEKDYVEKIYNQFTKLEG